MKRLFRWAGVLLLLVGSMAWADEKQDAEAAFKKGVDLAEGRHFKEALPYLEEAAKVFPGEPAVLWNLGIASVELGHHAEALAYWERVRKAVPEGWRSTTKIIQAHQALGNLQARDREIKALYARREREKDGDLGKADKFCREQFEVAGQQRVFAFESFDPQDPWRIYERFSVVDSKGDEIFFISLGSYDATTKIVRELGEIPATSRAYHVDRYQGNLHETYAHFNEKPSYEAVRSLVVSVLEGKRRPVSGSLMPHGPGAGGSGGAAQH